MGQVEQGSRESIGSCRMPERQVGGLVQGGLGDSDPIQLLDLAIMALFAPTPRPETPRYLQESHDLGQGAIVRRRRSALGVNATTLLVLFPLRPSEMLAERQDPLGRLG